MNNQVLLGPTSSDSELVRCVFRCIGWTTVLKSHTYFDRSNEYRCLAVLWYVMVATIPHRNAWTDSNSCLFSQSSKSPCYPNLRFCMTAVPFFNNAALLNQCGVDIAGTMSRKQSFSVLASSG